MVIIFFLSDSLIILNIIILAVANVSSLDCVRHVSEWFCYIKSVYFLHIYVVDTVFKQILLKRVTEKSPCPMTQSEEVSGINLQLSFGYKARKSYSSFTLGGSHYTKLC